MKVLVIGGAGYVGSIVRPALEAAHTCRYLDLKPLPDAAARSIVGDVNDPEVVEQAVQDIDAIVWLAMGMKPGMGTKGCNDLDAAFEVNVRGLYRVLFAADEAGVRRFVYASSLSVYRGLKRNPAPITEELEPDAWRSYGITKRIGEYLGHAWLQHQPEAVFVALRLMWPRNEADWPGNEYRPGKKWYPIGPNDLRRVFLAALECAQPGAHSVQVTGDLGGEYVPNARATELLGWKPLGN
jgi:nucleoside-diphosphate-sugar epimerase